MNLFAMVATFPLDDLTKKELQSLLKRCQKADATEYSELMYEQYWQQSFVNGLLVLAYDDDSDLLIGALSALDLYGLNTYEWSVVVDPVYRRQEIGTTLIAGLKHSLQERQASGEMVRTKKSSVAEQFLARAGYVYSSSEILLKAITEPLQVELDIHEYKAHAYEQILQMMHSGFGDTAEETHELIETIVQDKNQQLWVVDIEGQARAMAVTAIEQNTFWITAVTTHPTYQKQGYASKLLKWLKNYALQQGFTAVYLQVETDNPKAVRLYQQNGFVIEEQKDYFVVM